MSNPFFLCNRNDSHFSVLFAVFSHNCSLCLFNSIWHSAGNGRLYIPKRTFYEKRLEQSRKADSSFRLFSNVLVIFFNDLCMKHVNFSIWNWICSKINTIFQHFSMRNCVKSLNTIEIVFVLTFGAVNFEKHVTIVRNAHVSKRLAFLCVRSGRWLCVLNVWMAYFSIIFWIIPKKPNYVEIVKIILGWFHFKSHTFAIL